MSGSTSPNVRARAAGNGAWDILRRWLRPPSAFLYPLGPYSPACPDLCTVCRGPARPGFARCYQCGRHELLGRGLLAGAVVPVSYAVKGTPFAADLWRYNGPGGGQMSCCLTTPGCRLAPAPYDQARCAVHPGT